MLKKNPSLGLIALVLTLMPLQGCATRPISVDQTKPEYSAAELDCIADEWEAYKIGPCVSNALRDWMTLVDL